MSVQCRFSASRRTVVLMALGQSRHAPTNAAQPRAGRFHAAAAMAASSASDMAATPSAVCDVPWATLVHSSSSVIWPQKSLCYCGRTMRKDVLKLKVPSNGTKRNPASVTPAHPRSSVRRRVRPGRHCEIPSYSIDFRENRSTIVRPFRAVSSSTRTNTWCGLRHVAQVSRRPFHHEKPETIGLAAGC